MANLVAPVNVIESVEERIIEFKGLNRKPVVDEGEMADMFNLTSSNYPLLSPRKPRGAYNLPEGAIVPLQIVSRYNRIALIAKDSQGNVNFYYDKQKVDAVTGLSESTRMVAINTKMCFFPQKTYLEMVAIGATVTIGSYGNLEETFETLSPIDVTISNVDARIVLGVSKNFAYDDAINISGTLTYTNQGGTSASMQCTVSAAIEAYDSSTNTIILPRETFIELTGEGATNIKFAGTITRTMPNLDYILEWNNRLWGASIADNTIYACKLGDPKNWQYYQGTSLDSYYAQQGTDGIWTGCAPYSSHVIFFKQNSMTRVYGTSPASFQVANTQCYGIEEGSSKSVAVINDSVFYKSVIGIMVYEGGIPTCISDKFDCRFRSVVGGTEGSKYYASIYSAEHGRELMVLDTDKAVWHKEDKTKFEDTCTLDNKLYFITHNSESLKCGETVLASNWLICGSGIATEGAVGIINPENKSEEYTDYEWMATFGPFDEYIENRKIYSKLLMRLVRDEESTVDVYISINEGEWEQVEHYDPTKTGGDFIPIIPRRCDRYSVKVQGTGNCSVKSLTRKVRMGTGGRL